MREPERRSGGIVEREGQKSLEWGNHALVIGLDAQIANDLKRIYNPLAISNRSDSNRRDFIAMSASSPKI